MPSDARFPEAWLSATLEQAASCQAYPVMGPEGVPTPYVVFTREGTQDDLTVGHAFGDKVPSTAMFTVEIYADGYLQAKGLATAIRAAIRNFSGHAGALTILKSVAENDRDGQPVLLDGRETPTYTIEQSYQISWIED